VLFLVRSGTTGFCSGDQAVPPTLPRTEAVAASGFQLSADSYGKESHVRNMMVRRSTSRSRLLAILCAVVAATFSLVIGQGVASAAEGDVAAPAALADCGSSPARLCLWDGTDYTGARYEYGGSWSGSGCVNVPSTWNDRIGSAYNRLSTGVFVYRDANCVGFAINYIRPAQYLKLTANNAVTSVWFD
jgi:Peptidase inhibitor family I36